MNTPALTQADIDSLKPLVVSPNISVSPLSITRVNVFDPPTAFYRILCIPNNLTLTNGTCSVTEANEGSAPFGFGTGDPLCSTIIYADRTAFVEFHCFLGDIQVFNVISLNKVLTQTQYDNILEVITRYGFSEENVEIQTYN